MNTRSIFERIRDDKIHEGAKRTIERTQQVETILGSYHHDRSKNLVSPHTPAPANELTGMQYLHYLLDTGENNTSQLHFPDYTYNMSLIISPNRKDTIFWSIPEGGYAVDPAVVVDFIFQHPAIKKVNLAVFLRRSAENLLPLLRNIKEKLSKSAQFTSWLQFGIDETTFQAAINSSDSDRVECELLKEDISILLNENAISTKQSHEWSPEMHARFARPDVKKEIVAALSLNLRKDDEVSTDVNTKQPENHWKRLPLELQFQIFKKIHAEADESDAFGCKCTF